MRLRTIPVFLAFLAMGFGDAVGPFVSLAKGEFQLSNTVAALIPFVGFGMFALLSIPVGVLQDRRGKKFVLVSGLLVALAGLSNAAFGLGSFPRFLVTVLLLGAGGAILQVAGNPIMRDVSEEGRFARNLTLGQFVKAIGSLSGPLIPVIAARYFGASWQVIFPIYAAAVLITLAAIGTLRVNERKTQGKTATLDSCLALLKNRHVLAMVAAIFLYVGAEVSVSFAIPLFLLFVPHASAAVGGFFVAGLGFGNVFPLVFSIALERMPARSNEISGLMITAISGGAILPPASGFIADHGTVQMSFLVPLAAILYIGGLAFANRKAAELVCCSGTA